MKTKLSLFVLFVVSILGQGCMVARYDRTLPCGDHVKFNVYSCLANDKVSKIGIDKTTKTTTTGITIGSVDHEIDNEAVEAITKGVTAAILEAIKHL
jgi:hypothetical protein